MTVINLAYPCYWVGRNGQYMTLHLNVYQNLMGEVAFAPMTQRGRRANCDITFPPEDAPKVIDAILGAADIAEPQRCPNCKNELFHHALIADFGTIEQPVSCGDCGWTATLVYRYVGVKR